MRHARALATLATLATLALSACERDPEPTADMSTPDVDMSAPDADMEAPDADSPDADSPDADSPDADSPDADSPDADAETPDLPVSDCPEPLVATPEHPATIPLKLLRIQASGGTGSYRFDLVGEGSNATVNPITGDYLSGRLVGVSDLIRISDNGCSDTVDLELNVLEPMRVAPPRIELRPGQSFTYEVLDGSGEHTFEIVARETGGNIDPTGRYVAGSTSGRDTIAIVDTRTGQRVEALATVSPTARFRAASERLFLPLGQTYQLTLRGGSNTLTNATLITDVIELRDGIISTKTPGVSTITLTDAFTRETALLTVHVVESQLFEQVFAGEQYNYSEVLAQHDLDGDGIDDLIFAHPESNLNGWRSGAVFIFKGTPTGFASSPAQILVGEGSDDFFGHDIAVSDLDLDGKLDLVIGARLADNGAVNSGSVYIHRGVAGGLFDPDGDLLWSGDHAGDEFGWAVSICDFNGDGRPDIAVGASSDEDRTQQPVVTDQGAVRVFLNYANGGFLARPDIDLWGMVLNDAGAWVPPPTGAGTQTFLMGRTLASGDFDGDGLCDLAVGINTFDNVGVQNDIGAVYLYLGLPPDRFGPGGLSRVPSLAIRNDIPSANANFGYRVALGDANGDGKADLLVGAFNFSNSAISPGAGAGAAFLIPGDTLPERATAYTSLDAAATWRALGSVGSENMGRDVRFMHADADDTLDLAVASSRAIPGDGVTTRNGTLRIFTGGATIAETPARVIHGAESEERPGQGWSATQDRDGDGIPDLVVFSPLANTRGLFTGLLAFIRSSTEADTSARTSLNYDLAAAGVHYGISQEFVADLSGDGLPELAVGAFNYEAAGSTQINAGAVFIYRSTHDGYEKEPAQVLSGFATHSASDQFGYRVANAGDFNGDGLNDLAVVARLEDRPARYGVARTDASGSYFDDATWARNTCPDIAGGRTDSGAVYIFLGVADGLVEPQPAFILHGPQASQQITTVAGGFDINGDGLDDIIYGSNLWDNSVTNSGGFGVILGRSAASRTGTKLIPICSPNMLQQSTASNDQLGLSITGLGDLNDDGCDDFAVSARSSGIGAGNQGHVRVFLSQRADPMAPCALSELRMTAIAPGIANATAGSSLAGGLDVTGDGVPDLMVGGTSYRVGNEAVGGAWLVSGAYLRDLPTLERSATPSAAQLNSFLDNANQTAPYLLTGTRAGEEFGFSLALIPNAGLAANTAAVLVGARRSAVSGVADSGGATIWRFRPATPELPAGFETSPYGIFSGETQRANSLLGDAVSATVGSDGKARVSVSGHRAWSAGTDQGACFALEY